MLPTPKRLLTVHRRVSASSFPARKQSFPQNIWIHYRNIGMLNDVKEKFDIPATEEFYVMDDEMVLGGEIPAAI